MKQFHYSTAECFNKCPYKFKLTYLDELKTFPSDDPQNPLILGTTLHRGMETDLETAIREYMWNYPVIDDRHIEEIIKLEHWIPRMKELIPEGLHEVPFSNDVYMGTADLLVPVGENEYDLYDFKYSNNIKTYMHSRQLHVYKFFLEEIKGIRIRKMFFVFVPKIQIRQGKNERQYQFRKRLQEALHEADIDIREVVYDQHYVNRFFQTCMKIGLTTKFKKEFSPLCEWCEFEDYCKKGRTEMILPSNERRNIGQVTKRKIYIYGDSFTGKTTLCDNAPDPLNLNTDGNIQFVTMPFVQIGDQVTVEGRQTKVTLGWEVLKDTIRELQKTAGQNGFKTIVIDLVEDVYEMCRLYMYDKLGITHESDDTFKAWDKVRTEFFSTMREFFNLPYENLIIISKEDKSRDITKKSGDKVTQIKPNLQDKIATKLAGMVDIVVRAVVEDDGSHTLQFKTSEVVFGGGRLKDIRKTVIPCSWKDLMDVYPTTNENKAAVTDSEEQTDISTPDTTEAHTEQKSGVSVDSVTTDEPEKTKPSRRTRKKQDLPVKEDTGTGAVIGDTPEPEPEKPVRRTRKRRTVEE